MKQNERIIIFSTDTVYGMGCSIFDKESIQKIYQIKSRPLDKPLACLCADLQQIKDIAFVSKNVEKIINTFMPGALTVILKAKAKTKKATGFDTIGVRIPNSKTVIEILKTHGAMLTTSVNDSGKSPINEYDEIVKKYSHLADKIYPPCENSSNHPSTVVSLIDGKIKILRQGDITLTQIIETLK